MKKLYNFCIYSIKTISLAISVLVLFLVLTNRVYHPQDGGTPLQFLSQPWWFYVAFAVTAVCLVLAVRLVEKIPPKMLFALAVIVYLAVGMFIICNIPEAIRSDQKDVFKAALEISRGDYTRFNVGYELFKHVHNVGIATFYSLIVRINESTKFSFGANLLLIAAANWFIYKLSDRLFGENTTVNYTIIFSFAFIQQLLYLVFIYGNVPGFAFVVAMVYFLAKMDESITENNTTKTIIFAVLAVVASSCAILLRRNYLIAVVAAVIIIFLRFLKDKKVIGVAVAAILLVSIVLPQNILLDYYEDKSGQTLEGIPMVLYVAMGLQEDDLAPGWYNGYNNDVFNATGFDVEKSAEIGRENIKERLSYFAENPGYTYNFFKQKIISTWCEPTCQAVNSGPKESAGQVVEQPLLHNLYTGGTVYKLVYLLCNIVIANLLLFSTVYQLKTFKGGNINLWTLFPILFFVGGFIFHLVWETKSRYVWGYYLMLAPLAANGIQIVADKLKKYKSKLIF